MGLLDPLFEQRGSFDTLLDIIKLARREQTDVTVNTALTLTAVYRATSLIAGTVASLPFKTFRDGDANQFRRMADLRDQYWYLQEELDYAQDDRRIERLTEERTEVWIQMTQLQDQMRSHETTVRVVKRPNPIMTGFEMRERQIAHIALWGNSYSLKVRDGANRVVELWPILPDKVRPKLVGGRKVFEVRGDDGQTRTTDAREILHIPGFGTSSIQGLSPIGLARENISESIAARRFAGGIYKSGAIAAGLISTAKRLNKEQAQGIKQRWKDTIGGVENAGDIGILDQGMKFEKLSIDPQDLQFLETRQFGVTEIARLYGVPPHLLEDTERSTSWGSGIEEQNIGFLTYTLQPVYIKRIETRYTDEVVPRGQFAEFNINGLLRGRATERAEVYTKALDPETGWMERSEVRALENLPPEPENPQDEPEEIPGPPEMDSDQAPFTARQDAPVTQPAPASRELKPCEKSGCKWYRTSKSPYCVHHRNVK